MYRTEEKEFNFSVVLQFLEKYKKPLIIITVVAGILAVIFSGPSFIPPKYKATAIVYPATTNSVANAVIAQNLSGRQDVMEFGEEEQAEQLLQILQSDDIKNRIIKKYNLMQHYRIDPNSAFPYTKLSAKYNKNINTSRTEYMSVQISVLDESADTAARIANDIVALVDSVKFSVQRVRAVEALRIVESKYNEKQQFINTLVDSLAQLGKFGVFNYVEQSSVISEQYAQALMRKDQQALKTIAYEREMLGKYGPIQKALQSRLEFESEELARLHNKMEQIRVDANTMLPAVFVINSAYPAERKSYPTRSLIVLFSMASAFALTVIVLAVLDNVKRHRRRLQVVRDAVKEPSLADA